MDLANVGSVLEREIMEGWPAETVGAGVVVLGATAQANNKLPGFSLGETHHNYLLSYGNRPSSTADDSAGREALLWRPEGPPLLGVVGAHLLL